MFELAKMPSADHPVGFEYLESLELDADAGLDAWANSLNGYVKGLHAAGVIDIADVDEFDRLRAEARY